MMNDELQMMNDELGQRDEGRGC